MKFIHTADWHLGNSMHDIDRSKESEEFLKWLKGQIVETGAEALVVAGDIFDTVNPSIEARKQYYRFMASLLETKCRNVVVVGGNHDSGNMLDAPSELLDALDIHVVGSVNNRKIEDLVHELKNDSGETIAICCSVPFVRDLELNDLYKDAKQESAESLLKQLYADAYAVAQTMRGNRDVPIIATGHLYAAGLKGKDNEESMDSESGLRDIVGCLGNVAVDTFGKDFDYVALGHIHYATTVAGNERVRYSGSPFVMGFDEANRKHGVLLVDLECNAAPTVQRLDVPETIRFVQISGDLNTLKEKLRKLETELGKNPMPTYVDVILESGDAVNLSDALGAFESGKYFTIKRHRFSRSLLRQSGSAVKEVVGSVDQYSPEDYFKMLIASDEGLDLDSQDAKDLAEKYMPLFREALAFAPNAEEV